MPKLNNNEKRLLMVLGVGVFIIANVLGYFLYRDVMKNLELQEGKLRERVADLEKARDNVDRADQVQQWMLEHLKEPASEEDRENHLDNVVSKLQGEIGDLELSKNTTMSTVIGQHFIRSRYKTNVKGPWPQVKEFIYRLQSPEDFRLVKNLSMVPKKDELDDSIQLVEASLEIEKFWPATAGSIEGSAETMTNNEQPAAETVQPPADGSVTATPAAVTSPSDTTPAPPETPAPADSVLPPPPDPISPAPPAGVTVPEPPPPDNSTKPTL
jgi:hypothetical protein